MSPSIPILSDKGGVLAVNKPAGLPAHPGAKNQGPSLIELLAAAGHPVAPIHRLDRETSGVMLLSAEPEIRGTVGRLIAEGQSHKHYLALVHGRPRRKGILRRPLADGRRGRPLSAVTRYRVVRWLGPFALMHLRPETGRKHQLRKHMQGFGHAIVGDVRYPMKGGRASTSTIEAPGRLWLHAWRLELDDGRQWTAPLPEALWAHLEALARESGEWGEGDEAPPWMAQLRLST